MNKIVKYVFIDLLRNKFVLAYAFCLLALSLSFFSLEDNAAKGMLSLLNIVLLVVPMVSLLFSAIYIYNSSEFIALMLSQPLRRRTIWFSFFAGLSGSLSLTWLLAVGIPVMIFSATKTGFILLATGTFLSIIFVAIAMLTAVLMRDKAKGIGLVMLFWLYFCLLFDGLLLFLLFQFADYPLEKPMMFMSALNPVDLSRILILLQMDVAALMGYTGAVFKNYFGTTSGMLAAFGILTLWILIPLWLSFKRFNKKDI